MAWGGLFLSLGRPSPEQQKWCLAAASGFNYDAALHGASAPRPPTALTSDEDADRALADRGFSVNRSRVFIGSGVDAFLRAKSALLSWKHLALGWAEVEPDTPVKAGARFCICYKEVIPWVMFPLQIAYVTDDDDNNSSSGRRHSKGGVFAFGSGTLQGHLLAGEERFSVQVDEEERVWFRMAPAGFGAGSAPPIPAPAPPPRHRDPSPYPPSGPELNQTRDPPGLQDPTGTRQVA